MDFEHIMKSAEGVVNKQELRKMVDEMADDATALLIIADTSDCRDEETGEECGCGHINAMTVHYVGEAKKMPMRTYLLDVLKNCLFNR